MICDKQNLLKLKPRESPETAAGALSNRLRRELGGVEGGRKCWKRGGNGPNRVLHGSAPRKVQVFLRQSESRIKLPVCNPPRRR